MIEVLQDIYLAANQLEQQLFQSVSDRQARAIVKAVVQQINAALSRALQQTQLLAIVGSAKMGWQRLSQIPPELSLCTPAPYSH